MGARIDRLLPILCWMGGCAALETIPVDVQIDVLGVQPDESAQIRLCVAQNAARTYGIREVGGRYLLQGLEPVDGWALSIEMLDEQGLVVSSAQVNQGDTYLTTQLDSCHNESCEPCEAPPATAHNGENQWALAVRFVP